MAATCMNKKDEPQMAAKIKKSASQPLAAGVVMKK
jgi:hypothetical protein